jgi:hypothetical protein
VAFAIGVGVKAWELDPMIPVQDNPLAALAGWSPQDKKRLLAALTRELAAEAPGGVVPVTDDAGNPVVYLLPAHDPAAEYGAEWTVGYLLELQRRAATLDDSAPWSDVRGRLATGLGLGTPGSPPAAPAGAKAG